MVRREVEGQIALPGLGCLHPVGRLRYPDWSSAVVICEDCGESVEPPALPF